MVQPLYEAEWIASENRLFVGLRGLRTYEHEYSQI